MTAKAPIDQRLVDEIVDEIVGEIKDKREKKTQASSAEFDELRRRMDELEKAVQAGQSQQAGPDQAQIEKMRDEIEDQITRLEGRLTELRTGMIRLSGEVRKLKEGPETG